MVLFRRPQLLFLPLAAVGAPACDLDVPPIAIHPDVEAVDGGAPAPDGAVGHDGPVADAGALPVPVFRDDFERTEGPVDGAWKDRGPGTPEIWNGELCLQPGEQAEAQLVRAAYGYLQLRVFGRIGFEVHVVGDADDVLVLRWDEGGAVWTSEGIELAAGDDATVQRASTHELHLALDYETQTARIDVDGGREHTVPFVGLARQSALLGLRVVNGFPSALPLVNHMCVDDVYAGPAEPEKDPFVPTVPPIACELEEAPVHPCAARYCCEEQQAIHGAFDDSGAVECLSRCLDSQALLQAYSCAGCTYYSSSAFKALGQCMDAFCARESDEAG